MRGPGRVRSAREDGNGVFLASACRHNSEGINEMNTYPHDPVRAASTRLQGPFMLAPGRAIVDAQGNTVATVYGYHLEAPSDRDSLAHAVCAAMNASVST